MDVLIIFLTILMLIGLGVWGAKEEMKWIEDKMALAKKDKKAKKKERKIKKNSKMKEI